MTALAGVELESLVSEPDALTTRPPRNFRFQGLVRSAFSSFFNSTFLSSPKTIGLVATFYQK